MDVRGIKPGAAKVGDQVPVNERELDPTKRKGQKLEVPSLREPVAPRDGELPADEVTPGQTLKSLIEIKRTDGCGIDEQLRSDMQPRLGALAATKFSPEAQQAFIEDLSKKLKLPEDTARLAWIANGLGPAVMETSADVSILQRFFNDNGVRLKPGDRINDGGPGFQLVRGEFRTTLRALAEKGPATRRDVLTLLDRVKDLGDLSDLAWARNEIGKAKARGLTFADSRAERLLNGFFEARLKGHVGVEELGLTIRAMRMNGFDPKSIAKVKEMLAQCTKSDDGLFYAERRLDHEIRKALRKPENQSPERQAQIQAAAAELRAQLAPRLEGKLDRHGLHQELRRQYRHGKIDERAFLALTTTAATSNTVEQFAVGAMSTQAAIQMARTQAQLAESWNELFKTISDNMSDDTRDAHGRVIETADERAVKRMLKERLLKRLKIEPKRIKALSQRAFLLSNRQQVLSKLYGEKDPERRASLESALAGADVQLTESRGMGPVHG